MTGDKPVVAVHLNVTEPAAGEPTLMTHDEVNTLFHEFGHALHGMFSNVKYPTFAGTSAAYCSSTSRRVPRLRRC